MDNLREFRGRAVLCQERDECGSILASIVRQRALSPLHGWSTHDVSVETFDQHLGKDAHFSHGVLARRADDEYAGGRWRIARHDWH